MCDILFDNVQCPVVLQVIDFPVWKTLFKENKWWELCILVFTYYYVRTV